MSAALIVILIITGYFALAAAAAPRLMRLVYRDNLAINARNKQQYEEKLAEWRAAKDSSPYEKPMRHHTGNELEAMLEARRFGYWLALVWPVSLSFYQFGDSAFKAEIAAQHAKANAKVIADYEQLLNDQFDKELASANPPNPFRHIIKGWTK